MIRQKEGLLVDKKAQKIDNKDEATNCWDEEIREFLNTLKEKVFV